MRQRADRLRAPRARQTLASMWFKQLTVYRLPAEFGFAAAEIETALASRPLEPCGAYDMQRHGWIPAGPLASPAASGDASPMLHTVQSQHLLALGIEEKLLPASIVRQEAAERAALLEAEQGQPLSRRQLREVRDQVADELRARALTRRRRINAWLDPVQRRVIIDNATPAKAELVLTALRDTFGTFNAAPLTTAMGPRQAMTQWLEAASAPAGFSIDEDLELRAMADTKHCVRYTHHELDDDEVRAHLKAGLAPTRLGLTWRDHVSFLLSDTLQLRRVQFVGLGSDAGDGVAPEERFDNDFLLMVGELSKLIDELMAALGGEAE